MGVMPRMYGILRQDGPPLTYRVCADLAAIPGSRLGLLAGLVIAPGFPRGEMDGPVGVVILGRALTVLGYLPEIVVPDAMVPVIQAMQRAIDSSVPVAPESALTGH